MHMRLDHQRHRFAPWRLKRTANSDANPVAMQDCSGIPLGFAASCRRSMA